MWARTLCPLSSSTRNKALGSDSTTVPSISMAPSFLGMSSALRSMVMVRARARFGKAVLFLGGMPAPPGSRQRDEITGKGRYRARVREPRTPAVENPTDGPVTSVLDTPSQREPPSIKTLRGPVLFPPMLRAPDQRPDPGDRDQRPPRKPGAGADHGHHRPQSDQSRGHYGP